VQTCSAVTGDGIAETWATIGRYRDAMADNGELAACRARQAQAWMWNDVGDSLLAALKAHPAVAGRLAEFEAKVTAGEMAPATAARALLAAFLEASRLDSA
jgi:LAO/AO transport system kinase